MPVPESLGGRVVDAADARLVESLHAGFTLDECPFATAAARLGMREDDLLEHLRLLLAHGLLLRFGPVFRIECAGGAFVLAALRVPEARFDAVAADVTSLPEVALAYRRDHAFNLWIALASESAAAVQAATERIGRETGLQLVAFAPEHEYGVKPCGPAAAQQALDEFGRRLLAAAQSGLPLVPRPYDALAAMLGTDSARVRARLAAWTDQGLLRRIGAVPDDERLGPIVNAMAVWDVADASLDRLGRQIAVLPYVKHAYHRPRRPPHWPYNFFAVLRGNSRAEVAHHADAVGRHLGRQGRSGELLFVAAVLKKTGLRIQDD